MPDPCKSLHLYTFGITWGQCLTKSDRLAKKSVGLLTNPRLKPRLPELDIHHWILMCECENPFLRTIQEMCV